ncbi:MAG: hypothetical protein FWF77_01615 [Defluviitaleaceae bacterium]|nr:hypothetical protein [Defluviitaleaceae bacterium]
MKNKNAYNPGTAKEMNFTPDELKTFMEKNVISITDMLVFAPDFFEQICRRVTALEDVFTRTNDSNET